MKIQNGTLLVVFFAAALPALASNIVVPNGNFTNSANNGSVGGGLLGSGTSVIGTGPWSGTYNGALAILPLAPPLLDIDDSPTGGTATISGILGGSNALGGLVNNSGWFQQDLGASNTYAANTEYTLSAVIDADTLLSVSALDNFGAGIALLNGGNVLSKSSDPLALVSLALFGVGPDNYKLTLTFDTGASAPSGDIGVRLFDAPNGLATASLLSSVTFSNVTLDASPLGGVGTTATPEPRESLLTGLAMILLVVGWRKAQQKRGAPAYSSR